MNTLHDYSFMRFSKSKIENKHVTGARKIVEDKYEVIKKHGSDTNLISHLSNILTACFRFGIIPESFYCGILISLLKKNYS